MSKKDDSIYLGHMLDASRKIPGRVKGLGRDSFEQDEFLQLALAHLVQIIGEAARQVSPECRTVRPEVPWREITGMRSKIVHDYMDVSPDVLWEVVTRDIPPLAASLEKLAPPA